MMHTGQSLPVAIKHIHLAAVLKEQKMSVTKHKQLQKMLGYTGAIYGQVHTNVSLHSVGPSLHSLKLKRCYSAATLLHKSRDDVHLVLVVHNAFRADLV